MKKELLSLMLLCCGAATTSMAQSIYSQDFEASTSIPAGWSQTTNATDGGFKFNVNTIIQSTYFPIPAHTKFAGTNDDACNCTKNADRLATPVLNLSTAGNVFVSFDLFYAAGCYQGPCETLTLDVSTDGGTTYSVFQTLAAATTWQTRVFNMSTYAGQSNVKLRFNYNDGGGWLFGACIDNLNVYSPSNYDLSTLTMNTPFYVQTSSSNTITGTLVNQGVTTTTSMRMNYSINNGAPVSTNLSSLSIAALATYNYSCGTPWVPSTAGTYTVRVWADNINGSNVDQSHANDTATKIVTVVNSFPPHRVVVEEGTGTWCGWCPRGAVFMEDLAINHPGTAIGIAVHNADPMTVTVYDAGISGMIGGYPSIVVDRMDVDDPSNVEAQFQAHTGNFGFATLSMPSSFNTTSRVLTGSASITMATGLTGSYRLAMVTTQDAVTGTTSTYNQTNYYSSTSQNLPLVGAGHNWQTEPNPVPAANMTYDHVARSISGGFTGQSGSLPGTLVDGNTYTYTFTYTVPAAYNIANMHAYLLLIDQTTGYILNGNEGSITVGINENHPNIADVTVYPNPMNSSSTIGISLTSSQDVAVSVFNMLGENVATINAGNLSAGAHDINFDSSKLNSGVYFVKVTAGTSSVSKKIVVEK